MHSDKWHQSPSWADFTWICRRSEQGHDVTGLPDPSRAISWGGTADRQIQGNISVAPFVSISPSLLNCVNTERLQSHKQPPKHFWTRLFIATECCVACINKMCVQASHRPSRCVWACLQAARFWTQLITRHQEFLRCYASLHSCTGSMSLFKWDLGSEYSCRCWVSN